MNEEKQSLTEHLTELRSVLIKSFLAIIVTTGIALFFSPQLLDMSIKPLQDVLEARNQINSVIVESDDKIASQIAEKLNTAKSTKFLGVKKNLKELKQLAQESKEKKTSLDLVFVSAKALGDDGLMASDVLDQLEPTPFVVYTVESASDPLVSELMLEGANVVLAPPRTAVVNRMIRRAAATAGKAAAVDRLVVLSPLEPFFAYLKIALVIGLFLACPIWLHQAWLFISPGLYANERKFALPVIVSGSFLFIGGGAFAYFAMFPVMFDFLVNEMMPDSLVSSFTVSNYLGLLLRITVAFGVVFELPLALAMLAKVGLVNAERLASFRKYWLVISFILGAILTPADPISQLMMAVPLIAFYEVGIIAAKIVGKKPEDEAEESNSLEQI
ncbi:MAG: twin-arginine translocase subunit TatC [Myxococcota bacterium]|nr:twin-arginine translocase subunit TatC [Myxococcota bacterium]